MAAFEVRACSLVRNGAAPKFRAGSHSLEALPNAAQAVLGLVRSISAVGGREQGHGTGV